MNFSDFLENLIIDGLFRGGALTLAGASGSTAVTNKGIRAVSTAYVVGDVAIPAAADTGAGGKFLVCTTAGTSAASGALAIPNPGSTVTDGGVTWTAVSGVPAFLKLYLALIVGNKGTRANSTAYSVGDVISLTANGGAGGDTRQHVYRCTTAGTSASSQTGFAGVPGEVVTDGSAVFTEIGPVMDTNTGFPSGLTEVSGGSYARVGVQAGAGLAMADFAGTQAAASTTASTGTGGQTSNNAAINFPAPTGNWAASPAQVVIGALYDKLTGGNLVCWFPLTTPVSIASGAAAPSVAAAAATITLG